MKKLSKAKIILLCIIYGLVIYGMLLDIFQSLNLWN